MWRSQPSSGSNFRKSSNVGNPVCTNPPPPPVKSHCISDTQEPSAGVLNETAGTITLPIYKGIVDQPDGSTKGVTGEMFYIVTDTSDAANAAALGLNHSPKLQYANIGRATRKASLDKDLVCIERYYFWPPYGCRDVQCCVLNVRCGMICCYTIL